MALEKHHAEALAELLEEASRNLEELMLTAEAKQLEVRNYLPDELHGFACILREAYGIDAPNKKEQKS